MDDCSIPVFRPSALAGGIVASRKLPYIYVQNWKCGCSTIKRTLWAAEHAVGTAVAPGHPHQRIAEYPFVNDPSRWEHVERCFVFTFVRNPFARMLSAYLDKIVHHREPSVWGIFAAQHGLTDAPVPFRDFLELLARTPPEQMDFHWRPQAHTVAPHAVAYDFIGSMERFEDDVRTMLASIFSRDLPVFEHAPHRTCSTDQFSQFYGAVEIDLVRRICDVDFRVFGYGTDPAVQERKTETRARSLFVMQSWGAGWRQFEQKDFAAAVATIEPLSKILTGPVIADQLLRCHLSILVQRDPADAPESQQHRVLALERGLGKAATWKEHGKAMLAVGRIEEGLVALLQASRMRAPSRANLRRVQRLRRRLALLRAMKGRRAEALAVLAGTVPSIYGSQLHARIVDAGHRALIHLVATGTAVARGSGSDVAPESRSMAVGKRAR